MDCEVRMLEVAKGDVELLRKLVSDELDRRCAAIDDLIVAQYQVRSDRHIETAIAAVKLVVMELVRSPLAGLERKLGPEPVKVEEKPANFGV